MTEKTYSPDELNFSKVTVDLRRFSQYLKISNVIIYLYLPDEFIIDRPSKNLLHLLEGYSPKGAICHLVWHMACTLYTRALNDESFFLAGHKHVDDIYNSRKRLIDLLLS